MLKKLHLMSALLIILSMVLSACGAPAAAPEVTVAPVVTEAPKPTEPPAPTAEPTAIPEPAPDYAALFGELIANQMPSDKGYGTVKPAALSEELATAAPFILDVRTAAEVEKDGFIEGAVNIPVNDLLKNLDKLPGLDEPIVIYCASGHRGGVAFAALRLLGYTNVRNLAGGLGAWKKAELPAVTGSMPAAPEVKNPAAIVENATLFTALDEFLTNLPADFFAVKSDKLMEELASGTPPFVLDIRTAPELEKDGYIEGAVNISLQDSLSKLAELPAQDAPIVIYCASGHRGSVLMMALRMLGYTNVRNLAGGFGGWKTAKLPFVGGQLDWTPIWTEYLSGLPADQGYYTIQASALNEALATTPPFILDVREAAELEAEGYIVGAVHLPIRDLMKNLDKLPAQDQKIVVYCASGHRGSFATAALRLLGWQDVVNLAGGLGGWKKAEFSVETAPITAPVAGTAPAVDAQRVAAFDAFLSGLPEGFLTVKAPDLQAELGSVLVVDVRTAEEYAEGHIEGAINIPVNDLMANLAQLPDKTAKIVILCKSGHRGGMAMMALSMLGYTDVRNLAGGMGAWGAAQLPTVK